MPLPELNPPVLSQLFALLLIVTLTLESVGAWVGMFRSRREGRLWMDWCDEPRASWSSMAEGTAVLLVLLMLAMYLVPRFEALPPLPPKPLDLHRLASNLLVSAGLTAVLPAILVCSQRPSAEFGIRFRAIRAQIRDGVNGYRLALLPTAALILATAPFRNHDNQNSLLKLLADHPEPVIILLIAIAAVAIAPLFEEMMFRVILQGWLTRCTNPQTAIPVTAVVFAAIHGAIDGIALLPLAAVMGYVFHRRHSYLSVVVIHALFNATMLILALLTRE